MRRVALLVAAILASSSCRLDNDTAAPFVASATQPGACGTTESLFPKLLAFVRADRFAPLRQVIETRLLPTPDNPMPDPSLRTLLGAIVELIEKLGLDHTRVVVDLVRKGEIEEKLSPLLVTILEFMDGQLDGRSHYEASDAAALFIRECNPDHLLTAVEGVLRFESPSHGEPWLSALTDEMGPLLKEPSFKPFLDSFMHDSQEGRAAIVGILRQVMIYVADDNFSIDRINTLMDSAVYPAVSAPLRMRIQVLVSLLDEATMKEAGILEPLQEAIRCGLQHPEARDDLLGFVYDLVATQQVRLDTILDAASSITHEASRAEIGLVADAVHVLRTDLHIRDDLLELVAVLLSKPNASLSVPVIVSLLDGGVLTELLDAVTTLLDGCGRPHAVTP